MSERTNLLISFGCLLVLFAALTAGCTGPRATTGDPNNPAVVAVYGNETLTLPEFEAQYARSVGSRTEALDDSIGAYQDFLERYVDFRLKVMAAEDAGYATDSTILTEINGYRTSFARPYLLDKEVLNPLIEELYDRQQEMVDVSHILITVPPDATPADTLAAYNRIAALRDSLDKGADFGDLALRNSDDPSARRLQNGQPTIGYRGRLNFFSAGRMVAPFEEAAFNTPVGEVSDIVRSQFGYHLIYVHDRRAAVPDVRISHIMITPKDTTAADSAVALAQIQELKRRIDAGEGFEALAREYSADQRSGANGGDIGMVAYDNYRIIEPFRLAAFELEQVGDVSEVVETPFGFHLLKLTERATRGTLDERYDELKRLVTRLPRAAAAEEQLAGEVITERGVTLDTALVLSAFQGVRADSVLFRLGSGTYPDSFKGRVFATLGDSSYTFSQWTRFAGQQQVAPRPETDAQVLALADAFLRTRAINYAAAALEETDPEFRTIMDEFRDGLMLFKIMEDSVWTSAAQDSAALQAYFEAHRDEYRFPERTRIVTLTTPSDSLLQATLARLDANLTLDALAAEVARDTTNALRMDTVLIEGPSNSFYDRAFDLEAGGRTEPIRYQGVVSVLFRLEQVPPTAKTFEEARTEVVSDYQERLEDRLLARLRERYDVQTYPERVTRAFGDARSGDAMTTATQ